MRITALRHPEYTDDSNDMDKWRLTAKGGRHFIDKYLRKFSKRESVDDFSDRRAITYCPSFAKAALNKLKNTFYSRMSEIGRVGGHQTYIDACAGRGGGVDGYGSAINTFMGQDVLFEMMSMRRVGVYVDRGPFNGLTKQSNKGNNPYLYHYKTEDILTWDFTFQDGEWIYKNVLLRDYDYEYDEETGMPKGVVCKYRQVWLGSDGVYVQYWKEASDPNATSDEKVGDPIKLDLQRIPFVFGGLQESLLNDVCEYQIGLLNIASADMNYCFKANFPFYTEEYDPAAESVYTRRPAPGPSVKNTDGTITSPNPTDGSQASGQVSTDKTEVTVGSMSGRRYPRGGKPPQFIAPPTEPLLASIKKQEKMEEDIYRLIDLAASQAKPQHASAESKGMDDRGLESGLSYIGLELEYMEREIAKIWGAYMAAEPASIAYPTKYSLKSDQDKVTEAKALNEVKTSAPSITFAKEVGKKIANVMLGDTVPIEIMKKIEGEIDKAEFISSDPDLIKVASELGMVDAETGSNALGFDGKSVVPKAQKEHSERLAEIAKSQAANAPPGAARGVPDNSPIAGKDAQTKAGNA